MMSPFGCNHPGVAVGCQECYRSVALPGSWCGAVGLVWVLWDWCRCHGTGVDGVRLPWVLQAWHERCDTGGTHLAEVL